MNVLSYDLGRDRSRCGQSPNPFARRSAGRHRGSVLLLEFLDGLRREEPS
jgi:hypothetical protein